MSLASVFKQLEFDLIVVRVTKLATKPRGMAKPCARCLPRLKASGVRIRSVIYTNECGELVTELLDEMETDHVCSAIKYVSQF